MGWVGAGLGWGWLGWAAGLVGWAWAGLGLAGLVAGILRFSSIYFFLEGLGFRVRV